MVRMVATFIFVVVLVATVFTQPAPDPARRAGITVMRMINTAENAIKQSTGRYVDLNELINHKMMSGIRAEIVADGNTITYRGQQLRLALTADAMQYQVMVIPAETCGTAIFSDERGLIYTGKVLDC